MYVHIYNYWLAFPKFYFNHDFIFFNFFTVILLANIEHINKIIFSVNQYSFKVHFGAIRGSSSGRKMLRKLGFK